MRLRLPIIAGWVIMAGRKLVVRQDGHELILAQADNFDNEVEALRKSIRFQLFLDRRMNQQGRVPVEDVERAIEQELKQT